jgi:hypothetical protein
MLKVTVSGIKFQSSPINIIMTTITKSTMILILINNNNNKIEKGTVWSILKFRRCVSCRMRATTSAGQPRE